MPALHQTSLSGLENKGPTETVHNFDTVRYDFPHTSWTFDDDTKVYGFPLELRGPGLKKTLNHSVVAADLKDNSLLLVKLPFDPGCNEIWFTLGILGDPEKKGSPFLKGNINIHYESKSYDGDWQETDTQFTTDASAPTLIKIRNSFGQNGTFDTTAFRIAFGPGGSSAEGLGVLTEFTTFSVPHPEGFMYEL
ncbi:MAG: hypothetical protein M1814_000443 [Vezdaea aestivalis]|nr:MAG: hypothetical protein M1814_000443 [Vezdaea aestivalis]